MHLRACKIILHIFCSNKIKPAMLIQLSEAQIERTGLEWAGWHPVEQKRVCDSTREARFTGHYGIDARTARAIFMDLQTTDIVEAKIHRMDPLKLFITLYWMQTSSRERATSAKFKVDESTARGYVWDYAGRIQALKAKKVS
jgi:hypothetical protein